MKTKLTILLILFYTNVQSQSLMRSFFGGVASGLGELLVENIFGDNDDKNDMLKIKLQQLDSRVSDIEGDIDEINSQLELINSSIYNLDLRLRDVEKNMPRGAFGLGYGISTYDNIGYQQLKTLGVIRFMGAQLGLNLNVNDIGLPKNMILERNKNKFVNIVENLSFGNEFSSAYIKLGNISTSSFGHSFIFRNYNNDIIYNDRQFGLNAGINHSLIGLNFLSSNLSDNRLKAGRLNIRPFKLISKGTDNSFSMIDFGYSYITDKNIDNESIAISAYDIKIPYLINDFSFDEQLTILYLYGNYSAISGNGSGYGLGMAIDYNTEKTGIGFWYEFRNLESNFISGYFDAFYELGRYNIIESSHSELFTHLKKRNEYSVGMEITSRGINLQGNYVYNKENNKDNYLHLETSVNLPIEINYDKHIVLSLKGILDQKSLTSLDSFNLNSAWNNSSSKSILSINGSLYYPIGENIDIFAKYMHRDYFIKEESSGFKLKTESILLGLQYNWGVKDDY